MNRINLDLPAAPMGAIVAISFLAAVGILAIGPVAAGGRLSLLGVLVLTGLIAIGLVVGTQRVVAQVREEAKQETATDPDTGLATPFEAERLLAIEFAAAQRGRPLTVVLTQIEQFPRYAARNGRTVATRLLQEAARVLTRHKRGMHLTARHGSVEGTYLSIMSDLDPEGASVYAKRIRRALMSLPGAPEPPVVSSAIVAYDVSMASPDELLDQAERALAKANGAGGRVVVVGSPQAAQPA